MCVGREALENSRRPMLVSEPRFCDGRFLHESADETAPTCHLVISARQFKKAVVCGGVQWFPEALSPALSWGLAREQRETRGSPSNPSRLFWADHHAISHHQLVPSRFHSQAWKTGRANTNDDIFRHCCSYPEKRRAGNQADSAVTGDAPRVRRGRLDSAAQRSDMFCLPFSFCIPQPRLEI